MLGVEWRSLPSAHSSVSACRHAGWAIWYCNLCVCVDVGGTTENKLVYVCVCVWVRGGVHVKCLCGCVFLWMCRYPCVYIYSCICACVLCVHVKNMYTWICMCAPVCTCSEWKLNFFTLQRSYLLTCKPHLFFLSLSGVSTGFLANFALTLSLEWQQQHSNVNKNTSLADNLWS